MLRLFHSSRRSCLTVNNAKKNTYTSTFVPWISPLPWETFRQTVSKWFFFSLLLRVLNLILLENWLFYQHRHMFIRLPSTSKCTAKAIVLGPGKSRTSRETTYIPCKILFQFSNTFILSQFGQSFRHFCKLRKVKRAKIGIFKSNVIQSV